MGLRQPVKPAVPALKKQEMAAVKIQWEVRPQRSRLTAPPVSVITMKTIDAWQGR